MNTQPPLITRTICALLLILWTLPVLAEQNIKAYIPDYWSDGRYNVHTFHSGYTVIDTVIDTNTGLMWQRCSEGQSGKTCSGTAIKYTWQEALQQAAAANSAAFAGHSDWRLPNIKELRSLVARDRIDPSINITIFPNTDIPTYPYWSSSPVAVSSGDAWSVYFGLRGGIDGITPRGNGGGNVRLVRGGP